MFDNKKLKKLVVTYKKYFNTDFYSEKDKKFANHLGRKCETKDDSWTGEGYKWVAVQHFQDNWDINVTDFVQMLAASLKKARYVLLDSRHKFPFAGILKLAKAKPEKVKELFINLYDEQVEPYERYENFINGTAQLASDLAIDKWNRNYKQDSHAVSVYLACMYPDKYFIYSQEHMLALMHYLEADIDSFDIDSAETYQRFYDFYNHVREQLKLDKKLPQILYENLTRAMYPDPELTIVTSDLAFFAKTYIPIIPQPDSK